MPAERSRTSTLRRCGEGRQTAEIDTRWTALSARRIDALDELVGPANRLVDVGEHVQAVGSFFVEGVPLVPGDDGRRPFLPVSVLEQARAGRGDLGQVQLLAVIEELEVDQIARTKLGM